MIHEVLGYLPLSDCVMKDIRFRRWFLSLLFEQKVGNYHYQGKLLASRRRRFFGHVGVGFRDFRLPSPSPPRPPLRSGSHGISGMAGHCSLCDINLNIICRWCCCGSALVRRRGHDGDDHGRMASMRERRPPLLSKKWRRQLVVLSFNGGPSWSLL